MTDELKKKLDECQKLKDEYLAGWQRSRADFLNYKKEEMERIGEILKYANEEIILKFLPILDNIDLAESQLPEKLKRGDEGTSQSIKWTKGFLQIKTQIREFLAKEGIQEINVIGEKFDPNTMEVIEEVEGEESGKVVEEVQKGYKMNGKVIRPAKVKVAK